MQVVLLKNKRETKMAGELSEQFSNFPRQTFADL